MLPAPPCYLPESNTIGRYYLVCPITVGGKAVTYQVEHLDNGGSYAMKLPTTGSAGETQWRKRFEREAEILRGLVGAAFPRLFASGTYDVPKMSGIPFIVTGLPRGELLSDIIERRRAVNARPDIPLAVSLLRSLGSALVRLHGSGFVHRNLKPDRLAVLPHGQVQILDLLLGLGALHRGMTAGAFVGTPDYTAPEQIHDASNVDGRADLYSMGLVIHTVLMNGHPFGEGLNPREALFRHIEDSVEPPSIRAPEIPFALSDIVARLTRREPSLRFASAEELLTTLDAAFPR